MRDSPYYAGMTTVVEPIDTHGWAADASTFGARLALVRQRMAWGNVKEAANACGLPVESWRHWERDGALPRRLVDVAKQIAGATGCDYLWLVAGPDAATRRYVDPLAPRVVAPAGRPIPPQPVGPSPARGAVPRTRPIAGGHTRPVTPVPL